MKKIFIETDTTHLFFFFAEATKFRSFRLTIHLPLCSIFLGCGERNGESDAGRHNGVWIGGDSK